MPASAPPASRPCPPPTAQPYTPIPWRNSNCSAEPDRQFEPMSRPDRRRRTQNKTPPSSPKPPLRMPGLHNPPPEHRRGRGINTSRPPAAQPMCSSVAGAAIAQAQQLRETPGHGWVLVPISSSSTRRPGRSRSLDRGFPAAQLRATEQKKRLLVNFTGSDWDPPASP